MTNSDIRLQTSWYSNLKRKKLQKRLGGDGVAAFIDLLIYVGVNQSDGDLSRFNDEDIEAMAQWDGPPGDFMSAMRDLVFIEGKPGKYKLHDWEENNPWAAGARRRSESARYAIRKRWEQEGKYDSNTDSIPPVIPPSVSVTVPLPKHLPSKSDGGRIQFSDRGDCVPSTELAFKKDLPTKKKPKLPIEERAARTPTSKLVKQFHRKYMQTNDGTKYSDDIKKMQGGAKRLTDRLPFEDLIIAMCYLFDKPHSKYHQHTWDFYVRKISTLITEAKEEGYDGIIEEK